MHPFRHWVGSGFWQLWIMLLLNVRAFWWMRGCVLWGMQQGFEMLGHKLCMFDLSWYCWFSKAIVPIYTPSSVYESCSCSSPASTLGIVSLKNCSRSGVCLVVCHCVFLICVTLMAEEVERFSLCLWAILMSSLVSCLFKCLVYFSKELSVLFIFWTRALCLLHV